MDLNTLFGEFLKKVITEAVAEATKDLTERNEMLELRIQGLEEQLKEVDEKVDEVDLDRRIERAFEDFNVNEALDLDSVVEEVVTHRQFNAAIVESLVDSLQRVQRY